ncbi:hypothetical protein ACP70R_039839 [Stipagrostis hirtigluma subsp. patula]
MPSPATTTAAAVAASAPLHLRACARRRVTPGSCFLPSRAPLNSGRLTAPAPGPAPLLVHAPRLSPTAARAASPDAATSARSPASGGQMLVFVPPHPLIKHWVSVLRNEQTPCAIFKSAMAELGRLLIYEASRDWLVNILGHISEPFIVDGASDAMINCFKPLQPTITGEIETPVAVSSVEFIDPREPVLVVPILRAGLALAENASSVLPATKTYHLGLRRDEETLQPSIYLNNLPDKIPEGTRVLVVDPMLATGGTIVAAIDLLIERGANSKNIKVVSAVAAPPALQKLSTKFPGLHVYTGIIDPEVNEKGFIVPGLGDAGDRSFAT